MTSISTSTHLTYHEPSINTLLLISSFLLALNAANYILDHTLFCGLVGQILIGTAWGVPGGTLLSREVQTAVVGLGYIGLVLLVYEGGLSTSLPTLLSNLRTSLLTATTGILIPLALSFLLIPLLSATPLQAFASGAALSSTSLGTTFTLLQSCGVSGSRLGTILTSAAMLDDVVGLVMIAVVAGLGEGVNVGKVVRPLAASIGLLAANVAIGWVIWKTGLVKIQLRFLQRAGRDGRNWERWIAVLVQTVVLVGFVAVAGYAGASVLFAAFLAGATVAWWDGVREVEVERSETGEERRNTGERIYQDILMQLTQYVLKPFFFASIGFAIPITKMFQAEVVWKGIVYSALMFISKLLTGIWVYGMDPSDGFKSETIETTRDESEEVEKASSIHANEMNPSSRQQNTFASKLFAPALIGLAMVARGEIGFLIVGVAESAGIYESRNELYMVTIWAIFLCTVLGPISVGSLVKKRKAA